MADHDDRFPEDPEGVRILGADEVEDLDEEPEPRPRRERPATPDFGEPKFAEGEPRLRFPLSSSSDSGGFGPSTGELPHWTEPPTGATDAVEGSDDDWSSFTSGTPRWRDETDEWDDDVADLADDAPRLGALDEGDRDPEDFFSFDEIDPPPGRSVFDEVDDDDDDDVEERVVVDDDVVDDPDDPDAVRSRKIVVGGGRVAPGNTGAGRSTAIGADRDLGQAAMVGIAFLVVAAVLFYLGPAFATVLVLGVVTFAAAEFFTALRKVGYKPAALAGIVATAGLILAAYHRGEAGIPLVLALTVAVCLLWYLVGADEGQATLNIGVTLLGVGWIGLFGSYAAALLAVQLGDLAGDAGKGILFGAILCTVGYDTGGYFVGRSAGRSPLSAASPNKTIEGLAGGMILAVVVGVVYGFLTSPFDSLGDGLKLGLAVAFAAPLGDLCQSMIKRDLGIKDMGAVLPGHGGLLDRFDAMLFVLPSVYYVARFSDFFV